MSSSTSEDLDVLIVGGGPAGTMLALELAAQDINFRIIDKAPERSDKSRALIIQPRSFEVLNRHGDGRRLYEKGSLTGGPMAWMNDKPLIHFNIESVANHGDSEFGLPCLLSQVDTEAYLDECLRERYGREVKRGIEATSVVQDVDGVNVTLCDVVGGVEEKIRAKYVVGADGAHSVVRKASEHIKFQGDTYPQEFLMCDAIIENFKLPRDRYHLILETGLLVVFPMPGGWIRIMISRDKLSNAEPSLDEIKAVVRKALPGGGEVTDATWITNFRLHHRVVNSYRDGRLLLVGDAAHLHSPVGGQGLNTGMQDALNLGWKLGRVVRGDRPDSLLDTFDEERRRIGEDLVAKTDRAFKLVSMTNPMAVRLRNWVVPWLAPYVTSRANLETSYNYLSQFGIHYRESSIVQKDTEFSGPVMAGDRAPDGEVDIDGENTRFHKILAPESYNFVLFSGSLRNGSDLENMKRTAVKFEARNTNKARVHMIVQERGIKHIPYSHRLHRTYGFSSPGFVYMRPDGYVAAVGHLDQIEAFLEWLS